MRLSIAIWNTNSHTPLPSPHILSPQASPFPTNTQRVRMATSQTTHFLLWRLTHLEPCCCHFPTNSHPTPSTKNPPLTQQIMIQQDINSSSQDLILLHLSVHYYKHSLSNLSNLHPSHFKILGANSHRLLLHSDPSTPRHLYQDPPPPPTLIKRSRPLEAPTRRFHTQREPSTNLSHASILSTCSNPTLSISLNHEQKTYA
jgi:hypothetical protein